MSVLYVDLTDEIIEEREEEKHGYEAMKAFLEANEPGSAVCFSGFSGDVPSVRGGSACLHAFYSPLAGKFLYGFSQSVLSFALKSRGYSALYIKGRARRLSYITLRGRAFEVRTCEKFRLSSFREFSYVARDAESDIVMATGRAADVLSPDAALYVDGRELGMGGLGWAFSSLNLKGIVFENLEIERETGEENKKYLRKLNSSRFARTLRRESTAGLIKYVEKRGCLPIDGFQRRRDARTIFLDGRYLKEKYGVYNTGCTDCPVACQRQLQDESLAPDLFDGIAFGSLIDVFSSDEVMKIREEVHEAGIERFSASALFLTEKADTDEKRKKVLSEVWQEKKHFDLSWFPVGGLTPVLDPRGSGEMALISILGFGTVPWWSIYAPARINEPEISAIVTLYERAYTLALSNRGLPVNGAFVAYVSWLPSFLYKCPSLIRFYMTHVKVFGIRAKTLLREGWECMKALGEDENVLPDKFLYDVDGIEPTVVEPTRLLEAWRHEKDRLERKLFKKEKLGKAE